MAAELGRSGVELTEAAQEDLKGYAWPGNIRELRNLLERAVLLSSGPVLDRADLSFDLSFAVESPGVDTSLTLEEVERRHIEAVLQEEAGNVPRAAERLGVPRSTLYKRLKVYG